MTFLGLGGSNQNQTCMHVTDHVWLYFLCHNSVVELSFDSQVPRKAVRYGCERLQSHIVLDHSTYAVLDIRSVSTSLHWTAKS